MRCFVGFSTLGRVSRWHVLSNGFTILCVCKMRISFWSSSFQGPLADSPARLRHANSAQQHTCKCKLFYWAHQTMYFTLDRRGTSGRALIHRRHPNKRFVRFTCWLYRSMLQHTRSLAKQTFVAGGWMARRGAPPPLSARTMGHMRDWIVWMRLASRLKLRVRFESCLFTDCKFIARLCKVEVVEVLTGGWFYHVQ